MKFFARYKYNTPVVIENISVPAIKKNGLSINQIVQRLSNELGADWKVWADGVKEEPIMIGKDTRPNPQRAMH